MLLGGWCLGVPSALGSCGACASTSLMSVFVGLSLWFSQSSATVKTRLSPAQRFWQCVLGVGGYDRVHKSHYSNMLLRFWCSLCCCTRRPNLKPLHDWSC